MKVRTRCLLAPLLVLSVAGLLQAQTVRPWLHVEVIKADAEGATVAVNVPFSLAEVALDLAPDDLIQDGQLQFKQEDISIADLRRAWTELRAAGNAEFLSVKEKDKNIRIAREGNYLQIVVEERASEESPGEGKTVRIKMPLSVVDALLAGEQERLDVRAALVKLQGEPGEVVSVDDGKSKVRIWIDHRSEML